jgi:hypothetical protein
MHWYAMRRAPASAELETEVGPEARHGLEADHQGFTAVSYRMRRIQDWTLMSLPPGSIREAAGMIEKSLYPRSPRTPATRRAVIGNNIKAIVAISACAVMANIATPAHAAGRWRAR